MKCKHCGYENKETATFCTKCGSEFREQVPEPKPQVSKGNSNRVKYVILVIVAAIIVLAAVNYFGLNNESKSWELVGSYTGSGSGYETVDIPAGTIKVKISAYPIKNYDKNHLYVSGPNGESGELDWGPTSAVETKDYSFEFNSTSTETLTIDYYETVSWKVEVYAYQ